MNRYIFGAVCLGSVFCIDLGLAQTNVRMRSDSQERQNNQPQAIIPVEGVKREPLPKLPVSGDSIRQASEHLKGNYGDMERLPIGGQIQDAWDDANETSGIRSATYCELCIYRMNVREQMTSVIQLPEGMVIGGFDLGDQRLFNVAKRSDRILAIKPGTAGIDTNLIVYTSEGEALTFYVRAHGIHSKTIPDLKFIVKGEATPLDISMDKGDQEGEEKDLVKDDVSSSFVVPDDLSSLKDLSKETSKKSDEGGYFDVSVGDVSWVGYSIEGDDSLAPEKIFNDGRFTYLVYGDNWKGLSFPSIHVVEKDGIDQVVNFRIVNETLIIEEVADLISLKNGSVFLCIHYDPDDESWF